MIHDLWLEKLWMCSLDFRVQFVRDNAACALVPSKVVASEEHDDMVVGEARLPGSG